MSDITRTPCEYTHDTPTTHTTHTPPTIPTDMAGPKRPRQIMIRIGDNTWNAFKSFCVRRNETIADYVGGLIEVDTMESMGIFDPDRYGAETPSQGGPDQMEPDQGDTNHV